MTQGVAAGPAFDPKRRRNRLVLLAFAACAFAFLVLPYIVILFGSRDLCPATITSHGVTDGTKWEVLRNECGGDIGVVWQMRVIPDRGYSAVVMESRGGPEPIGWEQSGFTGQVLLSAAPTGETSTKVPLKLDPKGQPIGKAEFENGRRKPS